VNSVKGSKRVMTFEYLNLFCKLLLDKSARQGGMLLFTMSRIKRD